MSEFREKYGDLPLHFAGVYTPVTPPTINQIMDEILNEINAPFAAAKAEADTSDTVAKRAKK